jgi:hypothetical protein
MTTAINLQITPPLLRHEDDLSEDDSEQYDKDNQERDMALIGDNSSKEMFCYLCQPSHNRKRDQRTQHQLLGPTSSC